MSDLNDSLDDLLSSPTGEVRGVSDRAPEHFIPNQTFVEGCKACGGTGKFRGYSGRVIGDCFKCKGAGSRTFKSSPEARAKARQGSADRKIRREQEGIEAFKIANQAIWEWLVVNSGRGFEFAVSLMASLQRFGDLTANQKAAVERMIAREVEKAKAREERTQASPEVDTAGIDRLKKAFDTAVANAAKGGLHMKTPRITIGGVTISPAKADSKNPGALYVKAGTQYLGKVQNGRFSRVRECTDEQQGKVLAFIADPEAAAKAYGQTTGVCCICNATLTSKWKHRGIGPICAEKFGWG